MNSAKKSFKSLDKVPLFSDLTPETIASLELLSSKRTFKCGEDIITEGDEGRIFYIILSGMARIYRSPDIHLVNREAGDWFGEVSLLNNTTRTASITAYTDMELIAVEEKNFDQFLSSLPEEKRNRIKSSAQDRIITTIRHLPIFDGVPNVQMKHLGTLFTFEVFKKDEPVIVEGDEGDKFYIIVRGSAKVTKNNGSEDVYLDTRVVGEWFGAVALLKKTLRTASITAAEDLTLMVLEEKNFIEFLRSLPPALQKTVNEYAMERTVSVIKLIPFFRAVDPSTLELLVTLFHFSVFKAGDVASLAGDENVKFFFMLRGIAKLTKTGRAGVIKPLGNVHQNDIFGEEALLKSTAVQQCTATCVTTCAFLTLDRKAFHHFLELCPGSLDLRIAINKYKVKKSLVGGTGSF